MFVADDGVEWVVKPSGQVLRDGLVELVSARLGAALGVATAEARTFTVEEGLLDAMRLLDPEMRALAGRFVATMTVFGSRLQPGADWVQPRFATAEERNKIGHLWVFDTWIANADRRPDNPNLLVSDGRLLAIDHAQGLPWLSGDVPRGTPHVRDGFGADADVLAGDAAARGALERFTSERTVRDVIGDVPAAWVREEEMDNLVMLLSARARILTDGGAP